MVRWPNIDLYKVSINKVELRPSVSLILFNKEHPLQLLFQIDIHIHYFVQIEYHPVVTSSKDTVLYRYSLTHYHNHFIIPCSTKILREFYFADWRFFVVCGNKFLRFEMTEISGGN